MSNRPQYVTLIERDGKYRTKRVDGAKVLYSDIEYPSMGSAFSWGFTLSTLFEGCVFRPMVLNQE